MAKRLLTALSIVLLLFCSTTNTTRLLPSVAMVAKSRVDTQVRTNIEFTYHYAGGNKVTIEATLPEMENGGTYSPEINSEVLRPRVVVGITDIKDWNNGSDDEGEILNPI